MENSISRQNVNVNVRAVVTDPNVTVQYKTKVLQKNVVSGVNTLTPAMISEANTKYIIKYDYILSDNITIPANCVLEFDGGSISGEHTITGNNTGIQVGLVKIFNTNVTLAGSWNVVEVYPEWFGAVGDGVTDDFSALQKAANLATGNVLRLLSKNYYFTTTLIIPSNTSLLGNSQKSSILSYNGDGIAVKFGCFEDNVATDVAMCDITLSIRSATCTDGFYIMNVWRSKFSNIAVFDSTQDGTNFIGLHIVCALSNGTYWNIFDNIHCWFNNKNKGTGIKFDRIEEDINSNNNANRITNSDFHKGAYGVYIAKGESITIDGCYFEGCGKGVYTDYYWTRIINCRFEANDYSISFGDNSKNVFLKDNTYSSSSFWIQNAENKCIKPNTNTKYTFSGVSSEVSQAYYYDYKPISGVTWNVYNNIQNLAFGDKKMNVTTQVQIIIKVDVPGIVEFAFRTNDVYATSIGTLYVPIANQYLLYEFSFDVSADSGRVNATPNKFELMWRTGNGVTVTCKEGFPKITSEVFAYNQMGVF